MGNVCPKNIYLCRNSKLKKLKSIISKIPGYVFARKQYRRWKLVGKTRKEVFDYTFNNNIWGNRESISGDGSTINATILLRKNLAIFFEKFEIKSVLDIPCGDFNWMKEMNLKGINYMGGDIVGALIEQNNSKYKNDWIQFFEIDVVNEKLPHADFLFCRDLLVHLSNHEIHQFITNVTSSDIAYFAATLFHKTKHNHDILTGEWRPINLMESPFYFPKPMYLIHEDLEEEKCLGVWKVKDLHQLTHN